VEKKVRVKCKNERNVCRPKNQKINSGDRNFALEKKNLKKRSNVTVEPIGSGSPSVGSKGDLKRTLEYLKKSKMDQGGRESYQRVKHL